MLPRSALAPSCPLGRPIGREIRKSVIPPSPASGTLSPRRGHGHFLSEILLTASLAVRIADGDPEKIPTKFATKFSWAHHLGGYGEWWNDRSFHIGTKAFRFVPGC